jgi:TIR domain
MAARGRVFISYRRKVSWQMAQIVRQGLSHDGYDVFMDVTEMGSGPFVSQILGEIRRRDHFLVVLEQGALDCGSEGIDWFRREIVEAIARRRNIVPLLIGDFAFPAELPEDIAELSSLNGIRVWPEYVDEAMRQLRSRYLQWRVPAVLDVPSTPSPRAVAPVRTKPTGACPTEPVAVLPLRRVPQADGQAEPGFAEVMNGFSLESVRGPRRRALGRRRPQATG